MYSHNHHFTPHRCKITFTVDFRCVWSPLHWAVLVPRPVVRFLSLRVTERGWVTSTNRRMPVTNDVCTAGGYEPWLSLLVTNLPTTRPPSPFRATYTSRNNMQFLKYYTPINALLYTIIYWSKMLILKHLKTLQWAKVHHAHTHQTLCCLITTIDLSHF